MIITNMESIKIMACRENKVILGILVKIIKKISTEVRDLQIDIPESRIREECHRKIYLPPIQEIFQEYKTQVLIKVIETIDLVHKSMMIL